MRSSMPWSLIASLVLGFSLYGGQLLAADPSNDDPPDRVARLSYLKGEASLKPAGTDAWAPATLNRPLTTDDQLWVERNARAELQVGSANIHLDSETAFSFTDLSDDVLQMRLTDGAIHLNVRRLRDGEIIEVDTPQSAVTVTKPGDYHIEVIDNGQRTVVKNYDGECEITGAREPVRLHSREQIVIGDSGERVARESFTPRDEFDAWANERNNRSDRSASSRYVASDVIGYEDLDGNGDWVSDADYGYVWYPTRVAVGWSPYRYGHWAWIAPWGWTWVDDAPWGFAPFHYGRWAHIRNRWGWVPGPIRVRAVYAPALVAWVGTPGFSVSISFGGNVGWFPLAPREVYVPGYHCSRRHLHNVNYANTVIVNNVIINRVYANRSTHIDYRHRSIHDAVTVVSRDVFVGARPVSNHIVRVRDNDVREWRTYNAAPAIAPNRASTLGPRYDANASRTNRVVESHANRDVVVRRAPPPARTSFEQEQRAIRDNDNRPVPRGDLRSNSRLSPPGNDASRIEPSRGNEQLRNDRSRRVFDRPQQETRPSETPRIDTQRRQTEPALAAPNNRPREAIDRQRVDRAPRQEIESRRAPVEPRITERREPEQRQQRAQSQPSQRSAPDGHREGSRRETGRGIDR